MSNSKIRFEVLSFELSTVNVENQFHSIVVVVFEVIDLNISLFYFRNSRFLGKSFELVSLHISKHRR